MKKMVLLSMLLLVGCKGKQGDKGDPGMLTMPETVSHEFAGVVTSNSFVVFVNVNPNITKGVFVYLTDGTNFTESPYFLPGLGINVYHLYTPATTTATIQIYNAQAAGAIGYRILILTS